MPRVSLFVAAWVLANFAFTLTADIYGASKIARYGDERSMTLLQFYVRLIQRTHDKWSVIRKMVLLSVIGIPAFIFVYVGQWLQEALR